jgi:hypothetical protein
MLELTGIASVLRGISVMYWLFAVGALALALWMAKPVWGKALGALIVIGAFGYLPLQELIEANKREAYAREAWAYFKKKCETESGEKIYKTFTGVKSVLVVKPLPPASEKDLYDQFWYGDPYSASATSLRTDNAAGKLVYPKAPVAINKIGNGFSYVESVRESKNNEEQKYVKYFYDAAIRDYKTEPIAKPVSRFALTWEDISTPEDRHYWIAGSRLRVVDLQDSSTVAERIGFYIEAGFGSTAGQRRPWLASKGVSTTCPHSHDWSDRWFVLRVLQPNEENQDGK